MQKGFSFGYPNYWPTDSPDNTIFFLFRVVLMSFSMFSLDLKVFLFKRGGYPPSVFQQQ